MAESPRTARSQKPESPPGVILPDWYHSIDSREARRGSGFAYFPRTGPTFSVFAHGPTLPPLAPLGGSWPLKPQVKTCVLTQNGSQDQLHLSGKLSPPSAVTLLACLSVCLASEKQRLTGKGVGKGAGRTRTKATATSVLLLTLGSSTSVACMQSLSQAGAVCSCCLEGLATSSLEALPHSGQQSVAAKKWPAGSYH